MAWNLLTSVRRIRLMSLSVRAGKITLVRKPANNVVTEWLLFGENVKSYEW